MARPIRKRQDIERGVVAVIAEKGVRGATVQDIASAARVSPGLLYRYWRNGEDLAAEVYRAHYTTLVEQIGRQAAGHPGAWDKLDVIVDAFFGLADRDPVLLKFLLFSLHELGHNVPPHRSARAMLQRVLAEGMAQGVIRPLSVDLACELTIGVVIQPVIGALYNHLALPMSQHRGAVLVALRGVLASEPPRDARPRIAAGRVSRPTRNTAKAR